MQSRGFPRFAAILSLVFAPAALAVAPYAGTYSQNFNSMAAGTTTPADWFVGGLAGTDGGVDVSGNGAITGTAVQVDNGSITAGSGTIGNYNHGPTGNAASRSLGSAATTAKGHRAMEVRLSNQTGAPLGGFEIHYDGKQWRLESGGGDQALAMKYSADGVNFVTMGALFDFHSIQNTGTSAALDGETVRLNRLGGLFVPPAPIPSGATFYLRWFDFNDAGVTDHALAIDNVIVNTPQPSGANIRYFADGMDGYTGTVDTYLQQVNPSTSYATTTPIKWDGEDSSGVDYVLVRFDNIFGNGAGQVQATDTITSATLSYNVSDTGSDGSVNQVLVDWTEADTFNTFGGDAGVQADEYGAPAGTASGASLGQMSVDVTASVVAWQSNPAANRGWIIRPTGTDGVQISSRENGNVALRPRLTVLLNGGAPAQRSLQVNHTPYLQLGDAPLVSTGAGIGATDQTVIAWQTVEVGTGTAPDDFFEVEYRAVGAGSYTPVTPIGIVNTGVGTRVNRAVTITGLNYDADYEYRVIQKRLPATPVLVNTWTGTFRTRKHPSSFDNFSFAAYGDSANINSASELAQSETVNQRITTLNSAFVMLLGDNIYDSGTHPELDARFDPTAVPVNTAYIRNHIQYFAMGNHDAGANAGQASLDVFYCPIPAFGLTSPVAAPVGETPEKNYSFDYGCVHFTVIDSTAWGGPGNTTARANAITAWMDADLAASAQRWKIVTAHHPPKSLVGHSDTGQGMASQLVPVMVNRNVDLMLVGHSHDYQRSFPLTGYSGGNVTYNIDPSGAYLKGSKVIQVVAGTGGENIDGPAPTSATQWLAKAFGNNNGGQVGPFIIDVTPTQLTCKYTLAGDGSVKDQFTITLPGPTIAATPGVLAPSVHVGDALPDGGFTVRNEGTGQITYSIADDAAWLSAAPASGTSTGESDAIVVTYNTQELAPGVYSAGITISAPEAGNSPFVLPVTLTVRTVRPDFDTDGDVDLVDFAFLQRCMAGLLSIPVGCTGADINPTPDSHVDVNDLAIFLNCFAGADIRPVANCAG